VRGSASERRPFDWKRAHPIEATGRRRKQWQELAADGYAFSFSGKKLSAKNVEKEEIQPAIFDGSLNVLP
jgi:hypothetical protein